MEYIIETNNLTKKYNGKAVVENVSLHIKAGSIYGFVGENGSGKTTIMRLLMGLASPNDGSYSLYGINFKDKKIGEKRKHISAIVESPSLVPSMNAHDNLKYACLYYGLDNVEDVIASSLKSVGLENTGKKKVKNFSLGMKQRLGIAILLLNKPEILLLDEPMNGLDPEGIAELRNLIIELNHKGITFLISSHILSELEKVATDWGFINKGHLLKEMSSDELLEMTEKAIEIRFSDIALISSALKNAGFKDFKEVGPNTLRIKTLLSPLLFLEKMKKENIEISHIKTLETSVEEYYLELIKGGR